jgi:hypothetical protein
VAVPVRLLAATVLASHGIESVLLERKNTTTKYEKREPKFLFYLSAGGSEKPILNSKMAEKEFSQ